MSNSELDISTSVRLATMRKTLNFGKAHLSAERYSKVENAFNKTVIHSIIFTSIICIILVIFTFLMFSVKSPDVMVWGMCAGIVVSIIMCIVFPFYYRKHTRSGRIWFMLGRWEDTGDEKFRYELEKLVDESSK